ncbi:MAG: hypothetical protein AB7O43_16765 [Hyphomicrobiaceae bacterium]
MEIKIVNADITQVAADLLVMKHADGFYGADQVVADAIGFNGYVEAGKALFVAAKKIATPEVLFIGVGPLGEFRYERIQEFGSSVVALARNHSRPILHLALTIHGPGYGLDAEQAFLSMIAGIVGEWTKTATSLKTITVAERSPKRCELLDKLLQAQRLNFGLLRGPQPLSVTIPDPIQVSENIQGAVDSNVIQFGARAERKPRLFIAMPFADEFFDEYEIGFCEAAKSCNFVCERLDLEHFTGDVVAEIKKRIIDSQGVIALLNGHNPNVFLEVGFALAHNKPVILVAKEGVKLPFDVSGQRCILYRNISHLRDLLSKSIASLNSQGVLTGSGSS